MDSALIVGADGKTSALLFASERQPGRRVGRDLTYANSIKTVFDRLDVRLAL